MSSFARNQDEPNAADNSVRTPENGADRQTAPRRAHLPSRSAEICSELHLQVELPSRRWWRLAMDGGCIGLPG